MTDIIQDYEARVNVTYGGENGDLPDPVSFDANDADVKAWVTEAVQNGSIPGIPGDALADFRDFVVDRYSANEARPYNLIQIRPKTPFGFFQARLGGERKSCPLCEAGIPVRRVRYL